MQAHHGAQTHICVHTNTQAAAESPRAALSVVEAH